MKAVIPQPRLFLTLALFSLALILFDSIRLLNFPKSLVQHLTVPIQYGLYQSSLSLTKQFEFVHMARKATNENAALRKQLGDLFAENSTLRRELAETRSLVDQYNKLNPRTFSLLPARPLRFGRYLLIDRGSDDGVEVGQIVVFKDNYLGKVRVVSPKTAQVLLAQDADSKIPVFTQGKEGKARGILLGKFGSELLMDKILHEEKIEANDLVYSEGTEGELPRGLVMGKVEQVVDKQNEVFKQAKIEPIYEIADLDTVFVILNI